MPQPIKHNITMLKLDEVSLVDNPANVGARVAIWKRSGSMPFDVEKTMTDAQREQYAALVKEGMEKEEAVAKIFADAEAAATEAKAELEKSTKDVDAAKAEVTALEAALTKAGFTVEKKKSGIDIQKADDDYIEFEGEKVLKSALPKSVLTTLEKQNDRLANLEKQNELTALAKRADSELPNLAGTAEQKGKLLKSVESLDEADRAEMLKALKAADAAVKSLFKSVGDNATTDENSPNSKLEKMAKAYSAEHSVPFETAFSKVTESGEGYELLKLSYAERN